MRVGTAVSSGGGSRVSVSSGEWCRSEGCSVSQATGGPWTRHAEKAAKCDPYQTHPDGQVVDPDFKLGSFWGCASAGTNYR